MLNILESAYTSMALELAPETRHSAFVLINCDLGCKEEIISDLQKIGGVENARETFGAYDIVAEVHAGSESELREIITWRIRRLGRVRSTLTLKGIEGQSYR
ncbi:transcriptional regulator [Cenarchaeum symbiosum A]|uniref:Transcriptional regulator n=1 Tax=Cenarchaeum symbiosum (strain A) TaxID=414004 RepID=A0RUX2_CENSY|nr:transcriptional regulator [Cenarchaeum symbiosum A]